MEFEVLLYKRNILVYVWALKMYLAKMPFKVKWFLLLNFYFYTAFYKNILPKFYPSNFFIIKFSYLPEWICRFELYGKVRTLLQMCPSHTSSICPMHLPNLLFVTYAWHVWWSNGKMKIWTPNDFITFCSQKHFPDATIESNTFFWS